MTRKQTAFLHSTRFKQQTLPDLFGSSPPASPSESFRNSPSPGPSKRKRTRKLSASSSSRPDKVVNDTDSDVDAIRFEPEAVEISDDQSPRRPKKHKGLTGAHVAPKSAASNESMDETLIVPRNRKWKKKIILDSEDEALPRKRKLIKGVRPQTPDDDEDDMLEVENQVLESRLRSRGKMTTFQKNLEKFKMSKGKKRGEIVLGSSSSEADQSENSAAPFKGAKPHHSGESDASDDETDSNEDDRNFIVDDAEGVPPAQLPLAFSLSTHQDLAHHFKIVCQLFVHVAVRPLVQRRPFLEHVLKEEEYLAVPLQVTRRKLSGMRDSLVASSVWRSNFKKALETYPKFSLTRLKFVIPQCDACHLGGRLSTLKGRLRGEPYDEYDFEDLSDDELNESSEEDENKDSDSDGDGDAGEVLHLGRFCAARTQVYHKFSHWEHSLYKSLQREILRAQDETQRFVQVAYFGGVKPPRDLHDADRVMEWLDERGIINTEWQKVRQMMDRARRLERGEMDDDGNI